MTVRELIEVLKTMPQDFPVIYRNCSDYSNMEPEQLQIQRSTDSLDYASAIHHHNMLGEFRRYTGPREYGNLPLPTPADVVIFPGN